MDTLDAIQRLYDEGRFSAAKAAIMPRLSGHNDPDRGRLCVIMAHCCQWYPQGDPAIQYLKEAGKAGADPAEVMSLRMILLGSDIVTLRVMAEQFPNDPRVWYVLVREARAPGRDFLTHEQVINTVFRFLSKESWGTSVAKLCDNAARYFLAKRRNDKDVDVARSLLTLALSCYSKEWDCHNMGDACMVLSQVLRYQGKMEEALKMANTSVSLWERACSLDPENPIFQRDLQLARDYVMKHSQGRLHLF